jgi:outer membrane protein assembly factor BamE
MINSKPFLLLLAALLLGGCNLIYKQSIQQGNAIEQDSVDDLDLGMSKRQVSLIMGTPAIHDPFHRDRWDYIYTFRPRNNDGSQRNITLYFENDALTKIDDKASVIPAKALPHLYLKLKNLSKSPKLLMNLSGPILRLPKLPWSRHLLLLKLPGQPLPTV